MLTIEEQTALRRGSYPVLPPYSPQQSGLTAIVADVNDLSGAKSSIPQEGGPFD